MEIPKTIVFVGLSAAAASFLLSGCISSIQQNDEVVGCGGADGVLMEATTDPKATDYDKAKDPALLAHVQMAEAQRIQDDDEWSWTFYRNQVVGIGEIACTGDNGAIYLTPEGTALSLENAE